MNISELFGVDTRLLRKANSAILLLTKKINEASKSAPEHVKKLTEQRDRLLDSIDQYTIDLMLEDYTKNMESMIIDMIVAVKSRELDSVPLSTIHRELNQHGFDVDEQFLIDFLVNVSGVERVDPVSDSVQLTVSDPERSKSDAEAQKDADRIEKTAKKVAKQRLKDKNKVPTVEIK